MTTGERESYPSDGSEVSTESSDIWSDLVPDVSAPETPELPSLEGTGDDVKATPDLDSVPEKLELPSLVWVAPKPTPETPLPSLEVDGDLGNVDRGETEIMRDSARERLERVLTDFRTGAIDRNNLRHATEHFLGRHDKSKAADFAVIFALASTLDDSGRGQLFSQAISSDYRIATPISVSAAAGIISSNGWEIDHRSPTEVYWSLSQSSLGHLEESDRTEAKMLLMAFGVGRILSAGIRNNTGIDSGAIGNVDPEVQKLLALVRQLENTK